MLIDTHTHLYDLQFAEDRDEAIERALMQGVERLLLPAIDETSDASLFALSRRYPGVCFPMMGLHPTSVNDNPAYRSSLRRVFDYVNSPPSGIRFCGIGEIGLDFHWSQSFMVQQEEVFVEQLDLALRRDLPVVIHTRDAWDAMCGVLGSYRQKGLRGIIHSFSGTLEHYHRIKTYGDFCFGIGGPVTYKKSNLADLLPHMQAEDLVLETDSPYLPPVPYRGHRNESSYLVYICECVAQLVNQLPARIAEVTTLNARRIFGEEILG